MHWSQREPLALTSKDTESDPGKDSLSQGPAEIIACDVRDQLPLTNQLDSRR